MSRVTRSRPRLRIPIRPQETEEYCGPATLQILLSHLDRSVSQKHIIEVAKLKSRIVRNGARPNHLAKALTLIAPDLHFWFKQHTKAKDLESIVQDYRWPVAVNWQGLFYDSETEEKRKDPKGEHGHYSVVIGVDVAKDKIILADPYPEHAKQPRVFSLKWFEKRWWDVDTEVNRKTKQKDAISTKRFIFVIAPKDATFPKKFRMKPAEKLTELSVAHSSQEQ